MADEIENENTNNAGSDNAEKKQQHIKDRLKQMGVADDSVRPQKSRLARFANLIIFVVVAVLVVAYAYEYQASTTDSDDTVADQASVPVENTAMQNTVQPVDNSNQQYWQQSQQQWQEPGQWSQHQPEQPANNQFSQPQNQNDRYAQQRYWQQAYQYQPPAAAYWPPYGAYYGYRQPAYGGYYPQQKQPETTMNNQQQAPVYQPPAPYAGQPFYNGWYR